MRIKPNAKALEQIKPLYNELLKFEQMSLDRGVEFLKDFCKNSHKSYNELIFLQEAKCFYLLNSYIISAFRKIKAYDV